MLTATYAGIAIMSGIVLLNLISIILGSIATLIGVTNKDTWENGRPTMQGIIVIFLALLTGLTQVAAKQIEASEQGKRRELYTKIYTGWVSVGMFDNRKKEWISTSPDYLSPYLQGLEKPPENIRKGDLFIVKTKLRGRSSIIDSCLDFDAWRKTKESTIFDERQLIEILEVKMVNDCDKQQGQARVFAKITDGRL
jgi:hypothetical protein